MNMYSIENKGNKYIAKIKENIILLYGQKKWRVFTFCLAVLLVTYFIFVMNKLTPWVVDDLLKGQGAVTFRKFSDWYKHIHRFYFRWGGRIWGELFAMGLLAIPKKIVNVINTIVYLVLAFLIYFNVVGRFKISVSLFLSINFCLWAFLPAFGQDILWISGAANYMWSSIIPLFFLMFWRMYPNNYPEYYKKPAFVFLMFFLGIFSGWMNENVSVGILWLLGCYCVLYKFQYKKLPAFSVSGIIGTLIGSSLLWLAPGNFARFAAEHHSKSIITIVRNLFRNIIALLQFDTGLVICIVFLGLWLLVKGKNKLLAGAYFSTAFVCSMAFCVIGHIGNRVLFGCIVFLIIAAGVLYDEAFQNVQGKIFRIALTRGLSFG